MGNGSNLTNPRLWTWPHFVNVNKVQVIGLNQLGDKASSGIMLIHGEGKVFITIPAQLFLKTLLREILETLGEQFGCLSLFFRRMIELALRVLCQRVNDLFHQAKCKNQMVFSVECFAAVFREIRAVIFLCIFPLRMHETPSEVSVHHIEARPWFDVPTDYCGTFVSAEQYMFGMEARVRQIASGDRRVYGKVAVNFTSESTQHGS